MEREFKDAYIAMFGGTKKDATRVYKITDDDYHKEVIGWFKQNAFVAFYED